jgi:hypothetical protein
MITNMFVGLRHPTMAKQITLGKTVSTTAPVMLERNVPG